MAQNDPKRTFANFTAVSGDGQVGQAVAKALAGHSTAPRECRLSAASRNLGRGRAMKLRALWGSVVNAIKPFMFPRDPSGELALLPSRSHCCADRTRSL
jgi:hypothetical protein